MKNLLFLTWDSDKTNYLESLFFPIFSGIQQTGNFHFLVLQFSWARKEKIDKLESLARSLNIEFIHVSIPRSKGRYLGTLQTIWKGRKLLKNLISTRKIDAILPRSTMPAFIVNSISSFLKRSGIKIIFDADGFPIQERIDYSGLSPDSIQAKIQLRQEYRIIRDSDAVITRSQSAIEIHLKNHGFSTRTKFFSVRNGRDPFFFSFNPEKRKDIRTSLGISNSETCWAYVGSLGSAYAYEEMISIFDTFQSQLGNLKLLVLANDYEFAKMNLKSDFEDRLLIRKVPFSEVPEYLSAADWGISLRKTAPSLAGIFPIKLGEYLLSGLPVLATLNTGDSQNLLQNQDFVISVDLENDQSWGRLLEQYKQSKIPERRIIQHFAEAHFGLAACIRDYEKVLNFVF